MADTPAGMPAALQAALKAPVADRRAWQNEIAPTFIGLFLLFLYYDQLATQTLSYGGLGWSLLGAAAGSLLCFVLLYLAPALWGLRSRQPLAVVATSTFGAAGAPWVPGLVVGLVQVVWLAVTVYTAADLALRGLVAGRALPQAALQPIHVGAFELRSPLFLIVTLMWTLTGALVGIWLVRVVAAVMKGYAAFPAIALGMLMLWAMPGLRGFHTLTINPVTAEPVANGGLLAFLMMIQLVFSFFATVGASATDWGSYSRDARDVRLGGLVGVALAALILTTLPLLIVAGAIGRSSASPILESELAAQERLGEAYASADSGPTLARTIREVKAIQAENFTMRGVLQHGVGGVPACVLTLVFGLGLLGPTCFAPFLSGQRFAAVLPGLPHWAWSGLGAAVAWPLIALGVPARADLVFGLVGAAMAPVVGALAADFVKSRGAWPGPRRGLNLAGLIAWLVGFGVGLIPYAAALGGPARLRQLQPAAVLAFSAAFLAYTILSRVGLEPPALLAPGPGLETAPVPAPMAETPTVAEPAAGAGAEGANRH